MSVAAVDAVPAAPVAALSAAVQALAELDPQLVSADGLVAALEELHEAETRLAAVRTGLLAVAAERDATVEVTGRAPRSWLIEELLVSPGEASRRMRLARELTGRPVTRVAFTQAQISAEHALVVLDAVKTVPAELADAVEAALVDLSRQLPPHEVARAVDEILTRLGIDSDSDAAYARRHARRGIHHARTFAGTGSLSGTLTATLAEKLEQLFADCTRPATPEDDRDAAQRRHDRLEDAVDHYLGTGGLPDLNGERPRVVVTIALETLLEELSQRWGLLDSGTPISPATARRLACDAEIIPAVLGSRGEVLDLGVASRTFSTSVRRAAKLRDGGRCAFPRCRRPIAECHHIVWWSRGGRSDLPNAAWLCAFHHWLAHEGGWALCRNPNGSYTWTNPHGRTITGDPPHTRPGPPTRSRC